MSQFPHDEFAKDLLETLLTPFGKVETDRTMGSEVREIDVYFTPSAQVVDLPSLGLLQKCAATPASFEPFRNPVAVDEISNLPADSSQRGNVLKLFSALKVVLESKQNRTPKESESLMKLTTSPVFLEYVERITQDGRIEEGRSLVLRLLNRKLGNLSPKVQAQVNNLTIERVESLGEDLLDFTSIADLEAWLS
jgi:hypothetical protein